MSAPEKCAARDGACCWHADGWSTVGSIDVCCHCGTRRYLSAPAYAKPAHGPYVPSDKLTVTWTPHWEHTHWGVEPGSTTLDPAVSFQRWF